MEFEDEPHGRVRIVCARGRLDGATSAAFTDHVGRLIGDPEPRVLIDFSGVEFVSSAGLRAVLTLLKRIKAAKGALALCGVQPPVLEVLEITGFQTMIEIHSERAGALDALS